MASPGALTEQWLRIERSFKVMGGPATLVIDTHERKRAEAERVLDAAQVRLEAIESRYSRYRPDSLITRINQLAGSDIWTAIDEEFDALLNFADQLGALSQGLFDVTSGVLEAAWDFSADGVLNPDRIADVLPKVGWSKVLRDSRGVLLPEAGMAIDLGGIVKEFAADDIATLIRGHGFGHALVELAGDVVTIGGQGEGDPWRVGITDPKNPVKTSAALALENTAVATSGRYSRQKDLNGQSVSHFLDPRSGWPVAGPLSVTVLSSQCLLAGGIATVACLKSPVDAQAWLEESGLPWMMVEASGKTLGPLTDSVHPAYSPGSVM